MTKSELKNKIKELVKKVYSKTTNQPSEIDLDSPSVVSLDNERFPVLVKFPTLKKTITDLLTDQYELFLKDIEWVAPRPTTFRIILANDQVFYLIYTDRSWIAKIEGKKYYLLNINEEQNCIEAIARILSYGAKPTPKKDEIPSAETPTPPEEAPAEEIPAEENPALETPTA